MAHFNVITARMLPIFCTYTLIELLYTLGNSSFLSLTYTSYFIGSARTLDPTIKNFAPEPRQFDVVAGVNPACVQWLGLTLGTIPK